MMTVDDRQRSDPTADPGISGARFAGAGAAPVDVEQGGDDLEVVLHSVMHLADEAALALERTGHFTLRLVDLRARAGECVAEVLDFSRRPKFFWQIEGAAPRLVFDDCALQSPQRAYQHSRHDHPGDDRRS